MFAPSTALEQVVPEAPELALVSKATLPTKYLLSVAAVSPPMALISSILIHSPLESDEVVTLARFCAAVLLSAMLKL